MSVRNLQALFKPSSVALIGASNRPGSVGAVVARNLLGAGFAGRIRLVNRRPQVVEGITTYADIAALPETPDLAVIGTPAATVPELIAELAAKGTKTAVVITAGLGSQNGAAGTELRRRMLDAARPELLRIVGPNCLGLMVPSLGLNASFAHMTPLKGGLAFVAQSGAMVTAVMDWATARGIGFSHIVSLGDMADVDFGDMLDYLAADAGTRAVLLYVEAITQARKFMSAARACARLKPVVVIKAGRHAEGARAAASHTGAMAGSDAVYDTAIRRAGALRVYEMRELFDAVETLEMVRAWRGDRLAILTNGGGAGVLAVDALAEAGGRLATLPPATLARLDEILPPNWSRGNPVDIIGDAPAARYGDAMNVLLEDPCIDAILVLNCPTAVASSTDAARAVVERTAGSTKPVLTSWLGEPAAAEARAMFAANRIPTYPTPEQAVRGFMHVAHYHHNQDLLIEVPPSVPETFVPDADAARTVIREAMAAGRAWLSEGESKAMLTAYGIPVVETRVAATPQEAARAAKDFAVPVALKILSPDITHKSDVGGVALDLATPEAVRATAEDMRRRVAAERPEARIEGFTVQPMVRRPHGHELIVGMSEDAQFGPVILFGHGGTAVEAIGDTALALPPLNMKLARELVGATRVHRLLRGFRDRPAAALDDIALALVKVSQLVADFAEIAELDINPLLADEAGVISLDARIRLAAPAQRGTARFAIRPYPRELEQDISLRDGSRLFVRPVRPEDGDAVRRLFERLIPEDIRLRFFTQMKVLPASLAVRLTQIDYDREMTLLAAEGRESNAEALAIVRLDCDPDNERAEFSILVRSDLKGRGIGYALMNVIIEHARRRGVGEVFGHVLRSNRAMLDLGRSLGFAIQPGDEEDVVRLSLVP